MHVGIDNTPSDIVALVARASKSYDINVAYCINDALHCRIKVLERCSDLSLGKLIDWSVQEGLKIFRSTP